ncbi:MAG: hypothetical protein L3J11_05655, partial [Draconibacterium sp.]|nr:hypothetical protein [Draconibacterium sp.]
QAKFYYIFDYMAFNIPMLSSDFIGFGNLQAILIHRGIYFSLGVGFIFLTIFLLKRLPQSKAMTYISLILSIAFISAGGYLAYDHINQFKQKEKLRIEVVDLNNKYVKETFPSTTDQSIELEHMGETIKVTSKIKLKNTTNKTIKKLIFSLNDGLKLNSLKLNGDETPFLREKHLIIVSGKVDLEPGDTSEVEFSYAGNIDEALCYLDIDEKTIQEKYGKFVINVDKRYAFITPGYLLLTSEANWYPQVGVTFSSEDVSWHQSQFINFNLKVKTSKELKAISQGKINEISAGEFTFENEHPLTQISLAIGRYEQKLIKGDSIDFGMWTLVGHEISEDALPLIKDTIKSVISERFADFQRKYNLEYSLSRLSLIEVPAQFKTYERIWTSRQEMIQPEQILIPEKGYLIRQADLEGSKKRMKRWGRHGDNNMTPKDIEMRVFEDFLRTFEGETNSDWRGGRGGMTAIQYANPYFIFPELYNFQNNIQSDKWPITNRIFEAYLKSQATDMRAMFMSSMNGESEDERANITLQDSTFEEILSDVNQKRIIDNVIKLKGDVLFSTIKLRAGQEEFDDFLQKLLSENKFKNLTFEAFDKKINDKFGIDIIPIMDDWFKAKTLPGYLFSAVKAVKVKSGDMMRTMVSLKATNFSDTEGLVKLTFRMGGRRGGRGGPGGGSSDMIDKLVNLEPHQTKDLSYLLDADPRMVMINTMTSQNIPQVIMNMFREIVEDPKAVPFEGERISKTPVQMALPNETIVDNEDPEFEVTKRENKSILQKWILKDNESTQKYSGLNSWRPPANWTAVTNSGFYGEYVRSGYYIKGGDGSLYAKWHVPVKKAGYYDVYYYLYKSRSFGHRDRREEKGKYNFTIYGDDGPEEAALEINNSDAGWNYLGAFHFSSDTALVVLSNKSEMRMVFADAVKIVEL